MYFNFHITNFPFLRSNIPTSPAYGVFISQLIRYARACSSYGCFILRATRLSNKLLEQGYVKERLKSSLRKFYGRDLIKQYEVSLSQMLNDILWTDHIQGLPPYWSDFVPNSNRITSDFHKTFATGVACRQGTLTPPDTWSRPFGTCICSICWDQSFFELFVIFPDYALWISLGTFSILLANVKGHLLYTCTSQKCKFRVSKGISHLVFYGDLVYKLRKVKDTPNFISSGLKIVKRLRRRQYDPLSSRGL